MMKAIEFKYRKERSRILGEIYRPIAKVQLQGDEGWVSEFIYVDSGADFTLIPYKLGRFLGFKHIDEEIHEIQGVSGAVPVIFKTVNMRLGEYIFKVKIAWSQLEEVPLLLGRLGVFDRFDVTFRQKDKKVLFDWVGEE
jgi:hypothetical protein